MTALRVTMAAAWLLHAGRPAEHAPGMVDALIRASEVSWLLAMHTCRQRLLVRLPKHPTIAGFFWFAYFLAIALLVFS